MDVSKKMASATVKSYAIGVVIGLYAGLMIALHYGWKPWLSAKGESVMSRRTLVRI